MHVAMDIDVQISRDTKRNEALDSMADIQKQSIPAPASDKTISFFPDQGINSSMMSWSLCCLVFLKLRAENRSRRESRPLARPRNV